MVTEIPKNINAEPKSFCKTIKNKLMVTTIAGSIRSFQVSYLSKADARYSTKNIFPNSEGWKLYPKMNTQFFAPRISVPKKVDRHIKIRVAARYIYLNFLNFSKFHINSLQLLHVL